MNIPKTRGMRSKVNCVLFEGLFLYSTMLNMCKWNNMLYNRCYKIKKCLETGSCLIWGSAASTHISQPDFCVFVYQTKMFCGRAVICLVLLWAECELITKRKSIWRSAINTETSFSVQMRVETENTVATGLEGTARNTVTLRPNSPSENSSCEMFQMKRTRRWACANIVLPLSEAYGLGRGLRRRRAVLTPPCFHRNAEILTTSVRTISPAPRVALDEMLQSFSLDPNAGGNSHRNGH